MATGGSASALVREAALTGLRGREAAFARHLLDQPGGVSAASVMAEALAAPVGLTGKARPLLEMIALAASRPAGDGVQKALLRGLTSSGNAKAPKMVWLEKEPEALTGLRSALANTGEAKLFTALESRLAWPGKPGAPPPPVVEPLTPAQSAMADKGRLIYTALCGACHQPHGSTAWDGLAPPLVDSEWLLGKPDVAARIILHGLAGPVKVGSRTWNLAMPPLPHSSKTSPACSPISAANGTHRLTGRSRIHQNRPRTAQRPRPAMDRRDLKPGGVVIPRVSALPAAAGLNICPVIPPDPVSCRAPRSALGQKK